MSGRNRSWDLAIVALCLLAGPGLVGLGAPGCGWHGGRMPYAVAPAARAAGERPVAAAGRHDTEDYARIDENPFLDARDAPLSTFAVDVDSASYSNVRRFLRAGRLPPADAVRIEELINYFDYDYPQPQGEQPFSVSAEVAGCPWNPAHRLVRVGLQGRRIERGRTPPRNLVFLLDVSGSMAGPHKLGLLKSAMKLLVEGLGPRDRVAIAVYAGASGLVLEPTRGDRPQRILDALARLRAGGSTNGGAGIELAYRTARRHFDPQGINRVILATDGDFNVGVTGHGALTRLIERQRASGVYLTVLGFGGGNLKDATMESLADRGNGNYAYIDSLAEARKVLVTEAGATLVTIAEDVKIQVEFNPQRVRAYRLIGYENRLLRAEDFADDAKDAGEIGAGHSVTALYEIVPAGSGAGAPARRRAPLRYQSARTATARADSNELLSLRLRYKPPAGSSSRLIEGVVEDRGQGLQHASAGLRHAAAVAAFGMLLRGSAHRGQADYDLVAELAAAGRGADRHGYRREFAELVATARELADR